MNDPTELLRQIVDLNREHPHSISQAEFDRLAQMPLHPAADDYQFLTQLRDRIALKGFQK
jgi:hypothetical protein